MKAHSGPLSRLAARFAIVALSACSFGAAHAETNDAITASAYVDEALSSIAVVKIVIAETMLASGELPVHIQQTGLPPELFVAKHASLTWHDGQLTLIFRHDAPLALAGRRLVLSVRMAVDHVEWACGYRTFRPPAAGVRNATNVPPEYLPERCRAPLPKSGRGRRA